RETTEEDLWNLDEEAPAQPVKPRQSKPAPPTPDAKESVQTLEPTGAEPPMPRGLTAPVKPLTPRSTSTKDEIGELDDEEELPVSAAKAPSQDEVVTLASPIDEEPAPAPAAKVTAAPKEPEPPAKKKPVEAAPEPPAPQEEYEEEFEEHEEELLAKTSTRENRPRSAAPAAAAKANLRPRLNRQEVIGIATFAVVALIASVWMLTRFFTLLTFTRDSDSRPDYPLKGELVQIASGSTFWREPVRTGENRDVAKREVIMIPVLELSLDPEKSGGGSLRVIFRNAEGEPVGDPITRSFGAGRFEGSGNASSSFAATDGFTAEGEFQAYRTGKGKLWTADVLEGPPGGTPASAFKKLSSIPIFPERR
ncbi:MAG TPA: hypothetical protein VGE67_07920, partial [Haloferula sp.]